MKYKNLSTPGPAYNARYWAECRGLYEGGQSLIENDVLMDRLFPANAYEDKQVYTERKKRAVYLNYAGALIDHLTSSLVAEPVTVSSTPDLDPFYAEFIEDVDSRGTNLQELLCKSFCTALQCQTAWVLLDFPPRDDGAVIESAQDEEDIGALRAMAIPVEPESVIDYECDPGGSLVWALVCFRSQSREDLNSGRDVVTENYTFYTRDTWERYTVKYKISEPPQPEDEIARKTGGSHTFGRVPLVRLSLPHGLWAMDKLHNVCKEHFNRRSALSWAHYRACWPILGAFLAPEIGKGGEIPAEVGQDPGRADNQVYGLGRILKFGAGDELKYISPDPAIFGAGLADVEHIRDEIHRVMHSMAMASNTDTAIRRSGKSKEMDRSDSQIVLAKLGEIGRKFVRDIYEGVRAGRKDPEYELAVHGMQVFDTASLSDVVEDASIIDALRIPSQTFQQIRIFNTAKRIVAGIATPEQLKAIEEELEKNVTAEEFAGNAPPTSMVEWASGEPQAPTEPDGDEVAPEPIKEN